MNKGQNNRRSRSRGNGKHRSIKNQSFESNGPSVKVRGTAQQVLEKYLVLARDASSAGDRILAEGYFQHAEHYYRILNSEEHRNAQQNRYRNGRPQPADDDQVEDVEEAEGGQAAANGEARRNEAASGDDEYRQNRPRRQNVRRRSRRNGEDIDEAAAAEASGGAAMSGAGADNEGAAEAEVIMAAPSVPQPSMDTDDEAGEQPAV